MYRALFVCLFVFTPLTAMFAYLASRSLQMLSSRITRAIHTVAERRQSTVKRSSIPSIGSQKKDSVYVF